MIWFLSFLGRFHMGFLWGRMNKQQFFFLDELFFLFLISLPRILKSINECFIRFRVQQRCSPEGREKRKGWWFDVLSFICEAALFWMGALLLHTLQTSNQIYEKWVTDSKDSQSHVACEVTMGSLFLMHIFFLFFFFYSFSNNKYRAALSNLGYSPSPTPHRSFISLSALIKTKAEMC